MIIVSNQVTFKHNEIRLSIDGIALFKERTIGGINLSPQRIPKDKTSVYKTSAFY